MIYDHWSQVTDWEWKHFSPQEVACHGTGKLRINPKLLTCLELLRILLNRPIVCNSVYRSPYHNAKLGGAIFSQHLLASAADLSTNGQDRQIMLNLAQEVGFTGFGYYHTFLHVDLGRPREWGKEKWSD